jgi:hypothetical protein
MSSETGRIGLMVAGTAVGAYFGMAGVGLALGTVAGSLIFPTDTGGSRLDDLRVMTSSWGSSIARGFGTFRIGGNLIWSPGIVGGKKGGKGGTPSLYDYTCTFAVAFSEGVADDLLVLWADNKVIYSKVTTPNSSTPMQQQSLGDMLALYAAGDSGVTAGETYVTQTQVLTSVGGTKKAGIKFRFYNGTEEQLPDPAIQALEGVDFTSAYRGLVYVLFEDVPLADYGNRVPQIQALLTFGSAKTYPTLGATFTGTSTASTTANTGPLPAPFPIGASSQPSGFAVDRDRRILYLGQYDRLTAMDMETGEQRTVATVASLQDPLGTSRRLGNYVGAAFTNFGWMSVQNDGKLVFSSNQVLAQMDPSTGTITAMSASNADHTLDAFNFLNYTDGSGMSQPYNLVYLKVFEPGALSEDPTAIAPIHYVFQLATYGGCSITRMSPSSPRLVGPAVLNRAELVWVDQKNVWPTYGSSNARWCFGAFKDPLDDYAKIYVAIGPSNTSVGNSSTPIAIGFVMVNAGTIFVANPTATQQALLFEEALPGISPAALGAAYGPANAAGAFFWGEDLSSGCAVFDPSDLSLIFNLVLTNSGHTSSFRLLVKQNIPTGHFYWITELTTADHGTGANGSIPAGDYVIQDGIFCYFARNRLMTVSAADGVVVSEPWPLDAVLFPQVYDPVIDKVFLLGAAIAGTVPHDAGVPRTASDTVTEAQVAAAAATGTVIAFAHRAAGGGNDLAAVVASLCEDVGLLEGDIDVSQLEGIVVDGYYIGRPASPHDAIAVLAQVYMFDACESDGQIKFRLMSTSTSVRTISDTDIIDAGQGGEWVKETKQQDFDLPAKIHVSFMDVTNDELAGTVHAQRLNSPVATTASVGNVRVEAPLLLTPDHAAQIADQILFTAWAQRSSYAFSAQWKHIDLDPTDQVNIALSDGTQYFARLVSSDFGANMEIALTGRSTQPTSYQPLTAEGTVAPYVPPLPATPTLAEIFREVNTPNIIATPATPFQTNATAGGAQSQTRSQSIALVGPSKLFVFDLPLLRDIDDSGGSSSTIYLGSSGYGGGIWPGCIVQKSSDGTNFNTVAQISQALVWGTTASALPDVVEHYSWDDVTTLYVVLNNPNASLSSTNDLDVLTNFSNAFAVSNAQGRFEVINAVNCTQQANGAYVLSRILRGRRGTDVYSNGHNGGGVVIALNPANLTRLNVPLSEVSVPRYYRAESIEQTSLTSDVQIVTTTGADLKPWAPVDIAAVRTGATGAQDITLSWNRRTRIGGDMRDLTGVVALGEATEAYQVDVLSGPGGTVLRTLQATSPAVVYPYAQLTADLGTPTTISVNVYQVSSIIGRGFCQPVTIGVS